MTIRRRQGIEHILLNVLLLHAGLRLVCSAGQDHGALAMFAWCTLGLALAPRPTSIPQAFVVRDRRARLRRTALLRRGVTEAAPRTHDRAANMDALRRAALLENISLDERIRFDRRDADFAIVLTRS